MNVLQKYLGCFAILGVFLLISLGFVLNIVSIYNYGNRAEKQIVAEHKNLVNVLGQYSLKISEAAQVPSIYKEDVKEVITSALSARYGAEGSKATFQWLKEHNVNIDSSIYSKIQLLIESGRDEFKNNQSRFLDIKRSYETSLGYLWSGTWLRVFGYPKIDLSKFDIVTSEYATDAFKTGIDKGLKIR